MAISFDITAATHTGQARALFATLASGSDERLSRHAWQLFAPFGHTP